MNGDLFTKANLRTRRLCAAVGPVWRLAITLHRAVGCLAVETAYPRIDEKPPITLHHAGIYALAPASRPTSKQASASTCRTVPPLINGVATSCSIRSPRMVASAT